MTQPQDVKSASTPLRPPVQVVGERRLPDPPVQAPTTMPSSPLQSAVTQTIAKQAEAHVYRAAVMGTVNVLATVLAARMIVLVAVSGGISLTWMSLAQPDAYRLGALAIYCALCVGPAVWLAGRR